jgi:hypothetical protein
VLPESTAPERGRPRPDEEPSTVDSIAAAIEALYEREPKMTRHLLELLRAANISDLERLFR